jgi:acetyl esterase/lipase
MSYTSFMFRLHAGRNDKKRDRAIALPEGITQCRNISYGEHRKWNRLDVYYPDGITSPLPTIVSIHGGGYIYGSKEQYRRYCMDLARRGFSVINFSYRLAPEYKFPTPLEDTNAVLEWVCRHADTYHLDPQRLFLVGDSAGAQLASQYAAIVTNPEYAALFDFTVPPIQLHAVGLNCGMYDGAAFAADRSNPIAKDYLGRHISVNDPRLQVLENITDRFPPAHITTACHDFLREAAQPMADFLAAKGIKTEIKCYGTEDDKTIGHVFHVNISLREAAQCNDEQCAFFRSTL